MRIDLKNKGLLKAYSLNLIDENFLQLLSPDINSTYFLDLNLLKTSEENYIHNYYIKGFVKENLILLCHLFIKEDDIPKAYRMRNQFGTFHFNIKSRKK